MNNKYPFLPHKKNRFIGQGAIIVLLLFVLLGNVFYAGYRSYEIFSLNTPLERQGFQKLALIQNILDENYLYSEDVPLEQKFDGAATGLASSMGDPYTRYISNREYEDFKIQTEGSFGGIGVSLNTEENKNGIIIAEVSEGFSAAKAGLKENDIIIEVDGKTIKGMEMSDALALIRGEIGTDVTLKVKREGVEKPITVILQRKKVELPNISQQMLEKNTGYIHMARFSQDSVEQFEDTYKDLLKQGADSLIIDLRGNPGGLVTEAVKLTSHFLPANEDVVIVKSKDYSSPLKTEKTDFKVEVPTVIITDNTSASAAEIFAGAMKSHGKATIVGERTFGKGLIQRSITIDEHSALVVTVSEYLTPKNEQINHKGIAPDIEVSQNPEDYLKGIDTQLQKSIEYLEK